MDEDRLGEYPVVEIPNPATVAWWIAQKKALHLALPLPTTFEQYWHDIVDKDIRTQCRKASKYGFKVNPVTTPHHDEIGDLWCSWDFYDTKQGRNVGESSMLWRPFEPFGWYDLFEGWPFTCYAHTVGYLDFIEVEGDGGTIVAYAEVASNDGESIITSCQSHKDYINFGVMKLLFVSIIRGLIARKDKCLYYSKPTLEEKNPAWLIFAKDLGFRKENHVLPLCG